MTTLRTDVAIIGAGAAGLAAARRLYERGADILLIEARDRVGGRAYTLQTHDGSQPVELGAEFIHGSAPLTFALLRELGEEALDETYAMLSLRDGTLQPAPDIFESAERMLQQVDISGADESAAAFLQRMRRSFSDEDVEGAAAIIEGFDAASLGDAGIIGIAAEWRSGVNDASHRPVHGYAPLMRSLAAAVNPSVMLQTQVTGVSWGAQRVRIRAVRAGEELEIEARRAIVAVPAAVLAANAITFDPPLPAEKRAALGAIATGPVIKVVLDFRSAFWEVIEGGKYRDAGFFRAPERPMPTLWTRLPQRTTLLAAWAGGGAVTRVKEQRLDPVRAALDTAQAIFPSADVRAELRNVYYHDWQADPFARGAYSYLRVGAGNARNVLAQPLEQTLFFAGEATWADDAGTVEGAIASGYRAAEEVSPRRPAR